MRINGSYYLQETGDGFLLMPTGNDPRNYKGMCSFNETGAFIWQKLEQHCNMDSLLDDITKVYDIDRKTAERDTAAFLSRLEDINVIDMRGDG